MAVACGGYLRANADVISGKEDRKYVPIASHSVDSVGKHIVLCRNVIRSEMMAYGVWRMVALEEPTICRDG